MSRSYSNAKRLSSLLGDRISVHVARCGFAAGSERGIGMATSMKNGGEDWLKSTPWVEETRFSKQSNQVNSFSNSIRRLSPHFSVNKRQFPSTFTISSGFSTNSTVLDQSDHGATFMNHTRPLSPHLSIYKPQSNSMLSISNRISAAFLSAATVLFYVSYMKLGLTCFTYYNVYQLRFYAARLQGLVYSLAVPALLLHIFHG